MQVVITIARLKGSNACSVYLDSPEWDNEQQALVYTDWEASVARLLSTRAGTAHLSFLVSRELVPMTREEFKTVLTARRSP